MVVPLRILLYLTLWHVEIQSVDLLSSGISHEQRSPIGGQAHPGDPVAEGATKIFQAADLLHFMVRDAYPIDGWILAGAVVEVDVLSVTRPLRGSHPDVRELRPLAGCEIKKHELLAVLGERDCIVPDRGAQGANQALAVGRIGQRGNFLGLQVERAKDRSVG